jgi:soluble lytic murein transglycosylase-like protein
MKKTTALAALLAVALSPLSAHAGQVPSWSPLLSSLADMAASVTVMRDASAEAQERIGFPTKPEHLGLAGRAAFDSIVARHASANGVPIALAHAVIEVESSYRPHVRGAAGEVGLMQIKPATARGLGFRGTTKALYDPETNIRFGMKYLGEARRLSDGSTCGTILKYNAGHGARRMNPVSRAYCGKVTRILASR